MIIVNNYKLYPMKRLIESFYRIQLDFIPKYLKFIYNKMIIKRF